MKKIKLQDCIDWWNQASEEARWEFVREIGGDCVTDDVAYIYPTDNLLEPKDETP